MAELAIDLKAGTWRCQGVNADKSNCREMVGKRGIFVLEFARPEENITVALCKAHAVEPLRIRMYDDEAGL
jgi:hypothetical protein